MMRRYLVVTKLIFLVMSAVLLGLIYTGSRVIARPGKTVRPELGYMEGKKQILKEYRGSGLVPGAYTAGNGIKNAGYIPVLLYHGILETGDDENPAWDEFWVQMKALKEAGWVTVGMADLEEFVKGKPLPQKSFVLTFDDGRRDSFYGADPVLETLGWRAVMFVIAETMHRNQGFHMNETEIKQMADTGRWDVESHTYELHQSVTIGADGTKGYALPNKLWVWSKDRAESDAEYEKRIQADLETAKRQIEEVTGRPVSGLAFPYGDYGQQRSNYERSGEVIQKVSGEIYKTVFYQAGDEERVNYPGRDIFMIKRIGVEPGLTPAELLIRMGEQT